MENRLQRWLDGLKSGERLPKKNQLIILLLTGILLLVIVVPLPENADQDSADPVTASAQEGNEDSQKYEEYLEKRTEETLRHVEGVGEVEVMITLRSTGQKIVEKDQQSSSQSTEETDSTGGTRSTEESSSDKTSVYKQGTDGSQIPYVTKEISPEVEGVVVIADGGDNAVVVRNITEAVQALFGVEAHKIKIMKRADT
ncbi:stage III sporulation protein AG [Mediterraneibacter glycyrrhizinilyticus]|uniref:stage III sporulation protein AG n=1 Tax=Mediterraneibacter glycyrrhizinilyticus TaxID=342942 RepID=UPI0019618093|nr:stage III sporulation protein AG [Mediterraneibacter glycyrrhizinilyticus]MBM6751298.1 stage III sporulation protein AG [Mediterraneibacter glycyrrhizinilyticus]